MVITVIVKRLRQETTRGTFVPYRSARQRPVKSPLFARNYQQLSHIKCLIIGILLNSRLIGNYIHCVALCGFDSKNKFPFHSISKLYRWGSTFLSMFYVRAFDMTSRLEALPSINSSTNLGANHSDTPHAAELDLLNLNHRSHRYDCD